MSQERNIAEEFYVMGHESLIHVQKNMNDYMSLLSKYKGSKNDIVELRKAAGRLKNSIIELFGDTSDHEYLINGENVEFNNFLCEYMK